MRGAPKRNIAVNREILRALRGERTASEIANLLGVAYSTLLNIEQGRRDCAPDHLERLADIYGVNRLSLQACPRAHRGCRCYAEADAAEEDAA